jgi:hypothetical protein
MLTQPILAEKIRVRLHWGNTAEELEEDVNGTLEAYPHHTMYGMDYQLSVMPKEVSREAFYGSLLPSLVLPGNRVSTYP